MYKEIKKESVDISDVSSSCRPGFLWQKLYNYYSEKGGDLTDLNNLLIDVKNCEAVFDQYEKIVKFWWGFDGGSWRTEFRCLNTQYSEENADFVCQCDYKILGKYNAQTNILQLTYSELET